MIGSLLKGIGILYVVMWLLGSAGIIDFKFCIAPAGTCSVEVRK